MSVNVKRCQRCGFFADHVHGECRFQGTTIHFHTQLIWIFAIELGISFLSMSSDINGVVSMSENVALSRYNNTHAFAIKTNSFALADNHLSDIPWSYLYLGRISAKNLRKASSMPDPGPREFSFQNGTRFPLIRIENNQRNGYWNEELRWKFPPAQIKPWSTFRAPLREKGKFF